MTLLLTQEVSDGTTDLCRGLPAGSRHRAACAPGRRCGRLAVGFRHVVPRLQSLEAVLRGARPLLASVVRPGSGELVF